MRYALASLLLPGLLLGACSRDDQPAPTESAPTDVPVAVAEPELDPISGLKMTGDWQIVRSACTACHSAKLITQQTGSAEQWLLMIRWMQKKQNLWQFDEVTEEKIVNYLAENYPPSESHRRAALSSRLMPPKPNKPREGPKEGPYEGP